MEKQTCVKCGRVTPVYYLSGGYCDDCKWDTWIPAGYARREQYKPSPLWGHANATIRPPVGVSFLDHRPRLEEGQIAMCRRKPRSGAYAPSGDTSKKRRQVEGV